MPVDIVDDLVASFAANHVGQEAQDLAAMRAQLSLSLTYRRRPTADSAYYQPCNTPTICTPIAGFASGFAMHKRRPSTASLGSDSIEEMEESMLEFHDALSQYDYTDPTTSPSHSPALYPIRKNETPSHPPPQNVSAHHASLTGSTSADLVSSVFTSTDPFYAMVQPQPQEGVVPPPSPFAQLGRPATHSPFLIHHQHHQNVFPPPTHRYDRPSLHLTTTSPAASNY